MAPRIPVEIWQSIYDHLDREELSAISCCSKYFRQTAVGMLFCRHRIRLSEESIRTFEEGGSLAHLAGSVRDIIISNPPTYDFNLEYLTTFDSARAVCASLSVFPNITGVHIIYASERFYYWIFPIAVLRSISRYHWFHSLERLSVKGTRVHLLGRMYTPYDPSFEKPITPASLEFATGGKPPNKIKFDDTVPFPKALKELWMNYVLKPNFSDIRYRLVSNQTHNGLRYRVRDDDVQYHRIGLNPPVLCPHWVAAGSLTRLTFRAQEMRLRPGILGSYPSVKYLHAMARSVTSDDIERLADMMENVEELVIEAMSFRFSASRGMCAYECLARFPQLRRARVPWRVPRMEYLECKQADRGHLGAAVEVGTLKEEVAMLVGGGLDGLEYVDFVRGFRKMPFVGLDCREVPFEQYGKEICRVWRGGRAGVKFEGVWDSDEELSTARG
ncbi:hypothetical protein TWF481_009686 [Arthrobotrys musiformis]|uniref:F-box domain-containing protein n=1 Tax=Arthrobotrys musiformis TaxID=47236 RepID=A0AAV9W6M2_9PEZI